MTRYRRFLTREFKQDVSLTADWSLDQFGSTAAQRYRALILDATNRIVSEPYSPPVRKFDSELPDIWALHLRNVPSPIKRPRHVIYFSVDEAQRVVTMRRLLHESMDAQRHLTPHPPDQD